MPLNPSFGIELEFVCVYPKGCFVKYVCGEREQRVITVSAAQAIYTALLRRGVPVLQDIAESGPSATGLPHSRWSIHWDSSVTLTDAEKSALPEGWQHESIEISSRKFDMKEDGWKQEVATVLDALSGLEELGAKMVVNETTGFHVHIGNGNELIPLQTAKNVCSLVTAYSRCFDELHTIPRIAMPDDVGAWLSHHTPIMWIHLNNERRRLGSNVFHWFASIEKTSTYEELGGLFQIDMQTWHGPDSNLTGHNCAYNFDNLYPHRDHKDGKVKGTIEFRQHAGTLDFDAVTAWVLLTSQIVRLCDRLVPADFVMVLANSTFPDMSLAHLLSIVCFDNVSPANYYLKQRKGSTDVLDIDELVPSHNQRTAPLLKINKARIESLNDLAKKRELIALQWRQGTYGTHPDLTDINLPPNAIGRYLFGSHCSVVRSDPGLTPQQAESRARHSTLLWLAALYDGVKLGINQTIGEEVLFA